MKLLEKILVATDLMPTTENVVQHAIALGRIFDSEITLLHVLAEGVGNEKVKGFLEDAAITRLKEYKHKIEEAGVKTAAPLLKSGSYHEQIVAAANKLKVNLILIGAGEIQKGDNFLLGTTAERIIQKSGRPVWVVKQNQPFDIKTVLCPVDMSRESKLALKNAIILARRIEARVVVLSVFETLKSRVFSYTRQWEYQVNRARNQHRDDFLQFVKNFHWHGVDWEWEIREGDPAAEILHAVPRHQADMLFMGTTGRSGISKFMLGSVTEKVIREVPCTFMTSKTQEVIKLQLEEKIQDIETHYRHAVQLMHDGFLEESVREFKNCLRTNDMHLPSIKGLSVVYKRMGNEQEAAHYEKVALEIMDRIWNLKIESEVRGLYKY